MRLRIRLVLPLLMFFDVRGQPLDPNEVLERARASLQAMTRRLPNYACIETVERTYFQPPPRAGASCPLILAAHHARTEPLKLEGSDRLRLEVTVSEGHEIHAWPGATRFDTRDVDQIIRQGPIGTGTFGSHLTGIFDNPAVEFQYAGEKADGNLPVVEYRYHISTESSRYRVKTGSRWQTIPYDGTFWIDPESLGLRRLTVESGELPAASSMCHLEAALDYQIVHIGDGDVLLPREGKLQIVMSNAQETTNLTTFSDCREYMTESALHFEDSDAAGAAAKPMVRAPVALPIGLPVYLALSTAIDTSRAAAGDPVAAKVTRPVKRTGTGEVLIPAGSEVLGRLTRLERHLLPRPYFLISLSFNRLVRGDVSSPFAARYDVNAELAKELGAEIRASGRGLEFWDVGTFLFPSAKPTLVLPEGFESKWETLATPSR